MNWKKYKSLENKNDEAYYIIGLDIGNDSSAIAFYNLADGAAEAIDLSGGYGKPSIPTVMQYVPETKEWVFGEYAVLNGGAGVVFSSLLKRMGQGDYLAVGGRSVSVASVFALFVKDILGNVKNINPKAEIVGIVASIPAYFSDAAREEFSRVFKLAGYEKELIALVPDRECVLAYHEPKANEHVLIVDLGSRELRGGLYKIEDENGGLKAVSLSSVFDSSVSMSALNADVERFFASFLTEGWESGDGVQEQLAAFTFQHKDILFQKNIRTKPQKLYYNFIYPPAQHTVNNAMVEELVAPYVQRFNKFVRDVLEKNLYEREVLPTQVDAVLCVGGGFEMLWAKDAVTAVFPAERVKFYKNPKVITAEGAAIIAARELGIRGEPLRLEDKHQLTADIGLAVGESFITIIERNGFWWQNHPAKLLLVNDEVRGELFLQLAELSTTGERDLMQIRLDDLPVRPKGVTRLEIALNFRSLNELTINVSDLGFGEIFPKTDYSREFTLKL
jgi:molecular chaperone DnaK (HSP70)